MILGISITMELKLLGFHSKLWPTRYNVTVFYFCKLLYMFRVDPPPIIRSITLYLQHLISNRSCYLPLSWRSWVPTFPQ